jgi:hypothetical protein
MKTTIDTLKTKAASPAIVTAVVVAMAVAGGGLKLSNHNETLLRDRAGAEEEMR